MNIATILFTYNRNVHTEKVLDALSKNNCQIQKLFIFQDGMKETTNKENWIAVGEIIKSVSWCDTEVCISEKNQGLANSIISGINYVLETFDAVIVLEDDCVPHPQFMEYMVKALKKYEKNQDVYHIGASSEPVEVIENGTDAFFCGRINSCGWGTWKNRWEKFVIDYTMLGRIKADKDLNERFKLWAEDVESHILGNIYGKTDSWAAFWALVVIINRGYCMSPYESLIYNIGFDGSGVHSGIKENTLKVRPIEKMSEIILPDNIEMVEGYRKSFLYYYPWTSPAVKNEYYKNVAVGLVKLYQARKNIANWLIVQGVFELMIWGRGELCDCLIDDVRDKITIKAIIETMPKGKYYQEIPVISWKEIPKDDSLIILVPGYDIKRIEKMIDSIAIKNRLISIDRLIQEICG